MPHSTEVDLRALLERQKPGFALERPFYTSPELFEIDLEHIVSRQWLFVEHESEIPDPGDYLLYEIAGESIIVVRGEHGEVHALYNVCRHRGSRVCLEPRGRRRRFTCPYHSWSYGLDGTLLSARQMPADFDPASYALAGYPVKVFEGLIYINLSAGRAADFELITQHLSPFVAAHGLTGAKVVHRETYPTDGNWKLVVENFQECYHCVPAHPEYTDVNTYVRAAESGGYDSAIRAWESTAATMGHPVGDHHWIEEEPLQPHRVGRQPIREGFLTLTRDGTPAGPLMGDFEQYDGAETYVEIGPLHYIYGTNDHATLFRFTPITATHTEVLLIWMVRADAREGVDYDVDHLKWMWDVTTIQDTRIIGNNQKGVNSRRYVPGPYSTQETGSAGFTQWYLGQMRERATGDPTS